MTPSEKSSDDALRRAEKIYQALLKPNTSLGFTDPTELIAAEIREAVEADRSERCADDLYKGCYQFGRTKAFAEAAKIADIQAKAVSNDKDAKVVWNSCAELIAIDIRARAKELK